VTTVDREFAFRDADFKALSALVYERTGIVLKAEKRDMLYRRLKGRLKLLGLDDFAAYRDHLEGPDGDRELIETINAVTTNLTAFFREAHHFDHVATVALPAILAAKRAAGERRVRFWSAGCSTGQEPYSLAMQLLAANPSLTNWDFLILATDIDTDVVARAAAGRYPESQRESVPAALRSRFTVNDGDDYFVIAEQVKSILRFKQLNLLENWPMRGKFDVIFCRNVVIYFDKPTQRVLFDRYADALQPDGWLYIGHSESLFNVTDRFRGVGRTVYRRVS
jgi:chemotaxis protein methyltransferase CheR